MRNGHAGAIGFWDVSMGQSFGARNGSTVSPHDIADICRERAGQQDVELAHWFQPSAPATFHPLALTKPARWESAVAMAIFSFSGQVPLREEIIHGREILARLPRQVRTRSNQPTCSGC
ncbi:hypothetical protein [Asanoa iriomotensis]|uniref:Uncharacterized protein n=1 Tax=Asanoa iriomotensis TaxID=234613 RepID=A0ABQ4CDG2_9ACTN|nr:hypothetical protein [Asanoa iriomotensis]GIF60811.1 hypothetical protein Air01nite_69060 [Asanoa iriomotensis]